MQFETTYDPPVGEYVVERVPQQGVDIPSFSPPVTFSNAIISFNNQPPHPFGTARTIYNAYLEKDAIRETTNSAILNGNAFDIRFVHK